MMIHAYIYALLQNLAEFEASLVFLVVGLAWAWAAPNLTKCAVVMQFCACMLGVANPPPASLTGTVAPMYVRYAKSSYMGHHPINLEKINYYWLSRSRNSFTLLNKGVSGGVECSLLQHQPVAIIYNTRPGRCSSSINGST